MDGSLAKTREGEGGDALDPGCCRANSGEIMVALQEPTSNALCI
jgi:hypothetical protein